MRLTAALQVARAAAPAPLSDRSDAELLTRFRRDGDEAAFREVVRRYERLVRGASRRLTRDGHAVDDAVQATFLTLARRAHAIRRAEALPSWLYRVARSVTARPTVTPPGVAERVDPAPSPLDQLTAREVLAVFDEELERLPAAHRAAVLLCAVEGSTVEGAARRLGATSGAVRGWLQRGREVLRRRLAARGVELSAVLPLLTVAAGVGAAGPARDALVRAAVAARRPAAGFRLLAGWSGAWASAVGVLAAGVVSAMVFLNPGASDPPPASKADARPEAKADAVVTRDNLPDGAVARIGSPRLRHAGDVVAAAFSPDGRLLATVSPAARDKSVRVWDLADGTEKHRIPIAVNPHENSVRYRAAAVAFAPDGKRLLVLDVREFRAFDLASGRAVVTTPLFTEKDPNQFFPPEGVVGGGFSPDAKTFAAVRRSGELVLGDAATGAVKRTVAKAVNVPENTHYSYLGVLFTPDGAEVCVPAPGAAVPVFAVATGESKRSLAKELVPEHGVVNNAAFAADGRTFVAVVTAPGGQGGGYAVSVGDAATGKPVRTIPVPDMPRVLTVSPNGKLLAVCTDSVKSSDARVFDLATGKELQSAPLAMTPALVAFSPDSRLLAATCHYDGRVTVWDVAKNARHPQSADETEAWAHFDRRGDVVLYRANRAVTIDWRTGKVVKDEANDRRPVFAAASEDGKARAELDTGKGKRGDPLAIVVKDEATGKALARLEGLTDYPRRMAFADGNRLLVTATQDDVLTVWDVEAGKALWSEKYPRRAFGYAGTGDPRFDAANRRLAVCTMAGNATVVDVWELRRHNRVGRVEAGRALLSAGVAFSPDGDLLAGGNEDVTIWRVSDGKPARVLRGHAGKESPNDHPAVRCAFSLDGRKLLTTDGAGTIRVWEVATGQAVRTFAGHHGPTTAAFAPDARAVVGASGDAPVLVWDVYGLKTPPAFDADRVWAALADASAEAAFRAVRELCASPKDAVALLKEKVKPEAVDPKAVEGWVKDLSAEEFAARERAAAELEKQGEAVAPLLRDALRAATDAETRQRLAAILARADRLSPADLRVRRALDALEHLGTPEAKAHLEALSRSTPGCLRTVQAKEALARIAER